MIDEREQKIQEVIATFVRNPILAHRTLFRHRHAQDDAPFHRRLIELYHSSLPRVLAMIFRGGAKSTLAEECVAVKACTRQFSNCIVIGENEDRAKERLRSIRYEFENNEWINEVFGSLIGQTWGETKIELSTGIMIQAYGRGQALRGAKYRDKRPDFVFGDDLEDEENVLTEGARKKTSDWYWQVLIPALDSPTRTPIRIAATPLHDDSLAVSLSKLPEFRPGFLKVPVEFLNEAGERQSSWPDRFPLSDIDALRKAFYDAGKADKFEQEYMCEVVDETQKVFTPGMIRCEPTVRTWQPIYAIYDPARTVKATSAMTGKVVGSWHRNRLVIWEAIGALWKPDEIIEDMFNTDTAYSPVAIGVEEDGLHEFILQPLRHAQVERGHPLPIRPLKAPKGKFDFIRSLQPFFKAREVIFAGETSEPFQELVSQLLAFRPGYTGRVDVPNALAYFLKIRPGSAVYDGFGVENIVEDFHVERAPAYLTLDAERGYLCGAVCQFNQGRLSVIADFIREGDPAIEIGRLVGDARLEAAGSSGSLRVVAHRRHFDQYDRIGLRAGASREGITLLKAGDASRGKSAISSLISSRVGGVPAMRVATAATWTMRALQGGYCRALAKDGALTAEPQQNTYATLMQAVEGFVSMAAGNEGDDTGVSYDYTEDGRRFISARR